MPSVRAGGDAVLVVAYAFPPIQVQMSPVVARLVAGLHGAGFSVDVIAAHPDTWPLQQESSLLAYAEGHCREVRRLLPHPGLARRLADRLRLPRDFPDCMAQLNRQLSDAVIAAPSGAYAGVLSVSPFHSINEAMIRVKRQRPDLRWVAWFCDPWGDNPIETRSLVRRWNAWQEPRALRLADVVVHSSPHALAAVIGANPWLPQKRTRVVSHVFDPALYPARPKRRNDKITVRFVGTLFGRRTPLPLFKALLCLLGRRSELLKLLRIELIGPIHGDLFTDPVLEAALPPGLVQRRAPVPYRESLALMYDADILVVIEADVDATPFVPSKLMDYMGADTPVIGIVPRGASRDILQRLGCPVAAPDDPDGLSVALERAIDRAMQRSAEPWCDQTVRESYSLMSAANLFADLLRGQPHR